MRPAIVTAVCAAVVAVILVAGAGDDLGPNPSVVIGILDGAAFGLLALGIVLVYKGTRVFNFAQAEFGTLAAFFLFLLIEQWDLVPYPVGVVVALAAVTAVGVGMERTVIRPLLNAPRITVLVTTIAFALLAIGTEILFFRPEPKDLKPMIQSTDAEGVPVGPEVFDFIIDPQKLLIVGVLALVGAGLAYFFSRTDLGLAVLATSQDSFATRVVGVGVERMSRFIWGSAAFLGGVAGILFVPTGLILTPAVMTREALIPAFTAAVIGGMTSLPGAFLGGVLVGLIKSLSGWASSNYFIGDQSIDSIVKGTPDLALLLALLIVLLARPQGLLGREA